VNKTTRVIYSWTTSSSVAWGVKLQAMSLAVRSGDRDAMTWWEMSRLRVVSRLSVFTVGLQEEERSVCVVSRLSMFTIGLQQEEGSVCVQ
jgi:hypothetical protein